MWLLLLHDGYRKFAAVIASLYGLLCGLTCLDILASRLLLHLAAEYIAYPLALLCALVGCRTMINSLATVTRMTANCAFHSTLPGAAYALSTS